MIRNDDNIVFHHGNQFIKVITRCVATQQGGSDAAFQLKQPGLEMSLLSLVEYAALYK